MAVEGRICIPSFGDGGDNAGTICQDEFGAQGNFFPFFFFLFTHHLFFPDTYICGDHAAFYCSSYCAASCESYEADTNIVFPINEPGFDPSNPDDDDSDR